ncbi:hypothetical protein J2128_001632 [Methanomicrobium sp. W14]|uniref:hypothetical protein n=1 Tax=Methanomicrobium sp. W14 TaxID=2817839 RepID=UPI001AE21686|nr:hypothetical protein [Methanomicrobium sp. W14]MBP2133678.1 hypothetical protein [Methanomicrobium sp. W14]
MKETAGKIMIFVCCVLLATAIFTVSAAAGPQWSLIEVYNNSSFSADSPEISGGNIIFLLANDNISSKGNDVAIYNISSETTAIAGTPAQNMTLTGDDISGNYAVWFETTGMEFTAPEDETDSRNTVYLMDLSDGTKTAPYLNINAEWPKISENSILYSVENGLNTTLYTYIIPENRSEKIMSLNELFDPAGVRYDSGNILYAGENLSLYNISSRKNTVVCEFEAGINNSNSAVSDYDMKGDYAVYFKNTVVFDDKDNKISGRFTEPSLYKISENKSYLLNPKTGNYTGSYSEEDKKASEYISSPFTDGKNIGWVYSESLSESEIILFNPKTEETANVTIPKTASGACIDGDNMAVLKSDYPSFRSELVYAKKNAEKNNLSGGLTSGKTSPGFSAVMCIVSVLVLYAVVQADCKRNKRQ